MYFRIHAAILKLVQCSSPGSKVKLDAYGTLEGLVQEAAQLPFVHAEEKKRDPSSEPWVGCHFVIRDLLFIHQGQLFGTTARSPVTNFWHKHELYNTKGTYSTLLQYSHNNTTAMVLKRCSLYLEMTVQDDASKSLFS